MADNYDLLVIGAGPAGLAAAKQAAEYGVSVAIAEREQLGGVCVNRGCVPKKLMVYAADQADRMQTAQAYGWVVTNSGLNWQAFIAARDRELHRIHHSYKEALSNAGVTILTGSAEFMDSKTMSVGDRSITADKILIAVGGKPIKPPIPGIELTITSRQIFELEECPARLAIIGGGYIGVEFASIFHRLGSEVTLMNEEHCILSHFDSDVQQQVHHSLVEQGIRILCNTTAENINAEGDHLHLSLSGESTQRLTVDCVLCATGRTPNLESLHLERSGVEITDKHAIAVNDYSQTNQPHIFAVGDCTNRLPLTPAARAEGEAFAHTVFGDRPSQVDYSSIPSAVFARPEVASVGLTEAQARQKLGDTIQCHHQRFYPLETRLTTAEPMLIKQIYDASDRLIGVHIVGLHAAEMIQGVALAMKQGITKAQVNAMIGIHPTAAEELFA